MKSTSFLKTAFLLMLWILSLSTVQAQVYPDTIWVPVTFYDFHSDRSNPEFEQRHQAGLKTGMVAPYLDEDDKPLPGPEPYMNHYIKYWYRHWEEAAKGDYTIPVYTPRARQAMGHTGQEERYEEFRLHYPDKEIPPQGLPERFGGDRWEMEYRQEVTYEGTRRVDHDTSFINMVIEDSLPFSHIGDGVYEFRDAEFFPLDNRGFGNEWNHELENYEWNQQQGINPDRNYSFTMELHWKFVKEPGMTFWFQGDDDVWAFVDRRLALDLGGIKEAEIGHFNVDDLPGLEDGREYDMHVFYAERHSAASTIWIQTNIIFSPSQLLVYPEPGAPNEGSNQPISSEQTITAGVPFEFYGHIFDDNDEWRPEYADGIIWEVESGDAELLNDRGSRNVLNSNKANSTTVIKGTFHDPEYPDNPPSEVRITFTIEPGPAYMLDIVEDSLNFNRHQKDDFDGLYFAENESMAEIFAVVRDRFGNYIHHAENPQWQSLDHNVADVQRISTSSALVTKNFIGVGEETFIVVRQDDLLPDTIAVGSIGEKNVSASPNPFVPGKTNLSNQLPAQSLEFYRNVINNNTHGTLITIDTPKPLRAETQGSEYFGRVLIYDAVGNLVRSDLKLRRALASRSYGVVWDGYNANGRRVGPGVYLVTISGTDVDGKRITETYKVGVRK
ncbi:fibro-slime domain-containing protein [Chitinispirillales bacterium ANBcel5]|uniref:fibro-slime domain-containing protein n=1 Tax=Cellulosispirillum alkaliphilum TaxID=3039283 RepID=UPI002A568A2E|nr:fibro-slime domain-containing protein [Chitinispirillales bacterium ANBcel5]